VHGSPEPTANIDGGKLYDGSCHCGAVTLAFKTKPLDETFDGRVIDCDCSICRRVCEFLSSVLVPEANRMLMTRFPGGIYLGLPPGRPAGY
jgi:hypothetical protein